MSNDIYERYINKQLGEKTFLDVKKRVGLVDPKTGEDYIRGFLPSSPILVNRNTGKGDIYACAILRCGDTLESLQKCITRVGELSAKGAGISVYLGDLRPTGSQADGGSYITDGILPIIKAIDAQVAAFSQGFRTGAAVVWLPVWHPDINLFLSLKDPNESNYNKMLNSTMNLGVILDDEFMQSYNECIENPDVGRSYELRPNDDYLKKYPVDFCLRYVSPVTLMNKITKSRLEKGLPYIMFESNVNGELTPEDKGYVYCPNLCTEVLIPTPKTDDVALCALGTVDVSAFKDDFLETCKRFMGIIPKSTIQSSSIGSLCEEIENIDLDEWEDFFPHGYFDKIYFTLIDSRIYLQECLKESPNPYTEYREGEQPIGIGLCGVMDLIDFVVSKDLDPSLNKHEMYKIIFSLFVHTTGWTIERTNSTNSDLASDGNGIPSLLYAIAPNSMISLLFGNVSPGVTPHLSNSYMRKIGDNKVSVEREGASEGITKQKLVRDRELLDLYYEMVSVLTGFIDQGISMSLYIDRNNPPTLEEAGVQLYKLWDSGIKTVYYQEFIDLSSLNTKTCETSGNCSMCEN